MMIKIRSEWNAYYSGNFINSKYLVFEDGDRYYLWGNNFLDLTKTAVDVSSRKSSTKFLFECCFFNNLSYVDIPGISFKSEGECVLSRVCVVESYSLSSIQFVFSNVTDGESKNYVLESTFANCGNLGYGYCTIQSLYGNIKHANNNLTKNSGNEYATIMLYYNYKDDGKTNAYSTYYNCSSKIHLICCYHNAFTHYKCNFISNNGHVLFRANPAQVTVFSSFIFNNNLNYTATLDNEGTITIIDSTILNNGDAKTGEGVIQNPLNFSQYLFFFLNTKLCFAEEPIYMPIGQPIVCVHTCICRSTNAYFLVMCFILM